MKNILVMILLVAVASCGKSGGDSGNNDLSYNAGTVNQQGGVRFEKAVTLCPGGAVSIAAGQVLTKDQVARYFGGLQNVVSGQPLAHPVYARPNYDYQGRVVYTLEDEYNYPLTGEDLIFGGY